MNVHTYRTAGGKDLIYDYIDRLPKTQMVEGYQIIDALEDDGLESLETRQLDGKLWEIKFFHHNRIMYALADKDNIYLLHACKKQKNKAEKHEIETAKKRMKEIFDNLEK